MRHPYLERFVGISMLLILVIALSLRGYSSNGGPAWTYWLGNVVMEALIAFTGLLLMVGSAMSVEFVRKLHSLKNPFYKVDTFRRILWVLFGLLLTLFGGYMFMFTISQDINCRLISSC